MRTVPNNQNDRHDSPQRQTQPRLIHRVLSREHLADIHTGEGIIHVVEEHDDQDTSRSVVEQPGKDRCPNDGEQESVNPCVHPGYHERQVPECP